MIMHKKIRLPQSPVDPAPQPLPPLVDPPEIRRMEIIADEPDKRYRRRQPHMQYIPPSRRIRHNRTNSQLKEQLPGLPHRRCSKPPLMPQFHKGHEIPGQPAQKCMQHLSPRGPKTLRQLQESRPQRNSERPHVIDKQLRIPAGANQHPLMTDRIGEFRTKPERRARQRCPSLDHRLRLQVVPECIELDTIELPYIVAQEILWLRPPRIYLTEPFGLTPAGAPDINPKCCIRTPSRLQDPLRHH